MRSIHGWIINLLDGLAPPPGTVTVRAVPESTNSDISLTQHGIGHLDRVHVLGGSVSPNLADPIGHFGWDMELSPGPMDITVIPTDPQTEYRRRFPDESSQIGKAFLSDLERVGWAGGKSGIVWGAIANGQPPTPSFSWDATLSWQQGDGSIASFGVGSNEGRFVLRRFIAILGGVPFTVEMSDLVVPIEGEPPAPPNASGAERWDLYCAAMHDEPGSSLHGKQSFELFQGSPGSGFPIFPIASFPVRRIPLHLLKMPAGSASYTDAFDVRVWLNPPRGLSGPFTILVPGAPEQTIVAAAHTQVDALSTISSVYPDDIHLPMHSAWGGQIHWTAVIDWDEGDQGDAYLMIDCALRGIKPNGAFVPASYTWFDVFGDVDFATAASNTLLAKSRGLDGSFQTRAHAIWHVYGIESFAQNDLSFGVPRRREWTRFRTDFLFRNLGLPRVQIWNQEAFLYLFPFGSG